MNELTQDLVRELFDYRDGELYWKAAKGSRAKRGDRAGSISDNRGYRKIGINGKNYYIHRLIFLYHHGYLPEFLDHIDGDKSNNDINNLREATKSQNGENSKKIKFINGKSTSSDFKGVTWNKRAKKWQAQIGSGDNRKYLGYYDSEIEAALACDRAAIERDGEFALTNAMMFPEIFKTKEETK